ncbi:DUF2634 domain-containing protein [Intestinibacillus massiliensis]|uniref:DUF2634 domain-containing protein n=1 Tax=Intestinibacillus massiliensis TaxID=1871029 RepID=UPI000B35FE50|nr:DUF2634 domain-containing protein [Intestinibacillus massiliensis]MCB6366850.1 DUF2634 domain-containing protein [Intestinibacillus massiliensis]
MAETIFPYLQPEAVAEADALPLLREIKWDFTADRPVFENGEPVWVEREAAVAVWAWNALHTPRWRYEIHTPGYGSDVENLAGSGWSEELKQAEARQYVTECLLASPYITAVNDLTASFVGGRLTASFAIDSIYGPVRMEV